MYLEGGPYIFNPPEAYSRGKAAQFPHEGGPVILAVEIPDEVLSAADPFLPIEDGVVQFGFGVGIEELLATWKDLRKEIREL